MYLKNDIRFYKSRKIFKNSYRSQMWYDMYYTKNDMMIESQNKRNKSKGRTSKLTQVELEILLQIQRTESAKICINNQICKETNKGNCT